MAISTGTTSPLDGNQSLNIVTTNDDATNNQIDNNNNTEHEAENNNRHPGIAHQERKCFPFQ